MAPGFEPTQFLRSLPLGSGHSAIGTWLLAANFVTTLGVNHSQLLGKRRQEFGLAVQLTHR